MAVTDIPALAAELARAVEITMSCDASQVSRREAYEACDKFKENSPLCAEVGFYLASNVQHSSIARRFGLQLMEHTVKYKWNHISQNEKIFIKDNAMRLLCCGVASPELHIKDALSRVIVEMIKREWPQQWPGLLDELSEACNKGTSQTELTLLIFLRLVEDVAVLQTLESNQRRKDIYHALTAQMSQIFVFFFNIIELHVGQYQINSDLNNLVQMQDHIRVVQVALVTLAGFVEWVSINHIMANNGKLLEILCVLLNNQHFANYAIDCLLQIVSRKGKVEERKPLLILFNNEAMSCILNAAQNQSNEKFDEQFYLFQKKLVQVLNGLTLQLCSLWGRENGIMQRPTNFKTFLDAIIACSRHNSLMIVHMTNPIWSSLMKQEPIAKDPVFISYIPTWLEYTTPKIVKKLYPSSTTIIDPASNKLDTITYLRYDFDCELEYNQFFHRYRADMCDTYRQVTMIAPILTFNYLEQWLLKCLRETQSYEQMANLKSNSLTIEQISLEWEALSQVLDSVLNRILQAPERPSIANGLQLLEMCLLWQPSNPLLLSNLLSCISALFVFLSMSTAHMTTMSTSAIGSTGGLMGASAATNSVAMSGVTLLPRVLEKIFSSLMFNEPGQTIETRSRPVKNVRRHAASLMVKIGFKYPLLLLPLFDQIRSTVDALSRQEGPAQLSTLEKVTLHEALLLISNHFCDYERQSAYIGDVMSEANIKWVSMVNAGAFQDAARFIKFVGLDQSDKSLETATRVDNLSSSHEYCSLNRTNLIFCVNIVLGVITRCSWPDDPERAQRGGFVVGQTESGNPIRRNPAAPHVIPLLPHILALIKVFNQLYSRDAQNLLSSNYVNVMNILEVERTNLLGLVGYQNNSQGNLNGNYYNNANSNQQLTSDYDSSNGQKSSPSERMQTFLNAIHESCIHMMGSAGMSLGRDLYQLPGIGPAICDSILANLYDVPDYRLRSIVRVFLKPFIHSCPPALYEPVVLPMAAHIFPFMSKRFIERWPKILQDNNELAMAAHQNNTTYLNNEDKNNDTEEIIEDILIRAVTREYLNVLRVSLIGGSLPNVANASTQDGGNTEMDELSMDASTLPTPSRNSVTNDVISDLGVLLLRNATTCEHLFITILGAISCNDSISSQKATQLLGPVVRQIINDNLLNNEMASYVMGHILRGLALHGQYDANLGCLLSFGAYLYELMRIRYPSVQLVMQQIPNINMIDLQKLDEKIAATANAALHTNNKMTKVDKTKKELFKKITNPLIGKSIGQLFRKEVKIENLPTLHIPSMKQKSGSVDFNLETLFQ